ncbi:MAG: acyl-CoA thioesterase II [Gammaproteobacteria bacterium]|nr:acyl-CoA thioesterase II [Gammaproteobacteria bacterium]
MNHILEDLIRLLDLERLEDNLFRGASRDLGGKSVFGGQVAGQALAAAARTVEDRQPHSMHGYFLRAGDMTAPIVYEVDRVRDGRHFSARRVQAIQFGRPIFTMIASFQQPEGGLEHQLPMPEVPPPEALQDQRELRRQWLARYRQPLPDRLRAAFLRELAIEFRPVQPWNPLAPEAGPPRQQIWMRAAGRLPDDPLLHRCVMAYASDFSLLSTALIPHAKSFLHPDMMVASIDHGLWFHQYGRADDWLLYAMDSPGAQGARGFSRGLIYSRDGRLLASVAQENLMRQVAGVSVGA